MKRFNYTGRKRIHHSDVELSIDHIPGGKPKFDIKVDLQGYGLPSEAHVHVEAASSQTRWMRFSIGNVAEKIESIGLVLEEFDDADDLKFKLKVVDPDHGMLLALGDRIRPFSKGDEDAPATTSILPVKSCDLSGNSVLWRVSYDADVTLQVERDLGSKDTVVKSHIFKALILPAALKEILLKMDVDRAWDVELQDFSDWPTRWVMFAKQLGAGLPDNASEADNSEWMDDVITRFMNRINVRNSFINEFEKKVW